jgi:hypothetical protein
MTKGSSSALATLEEARARGDLNVLQPVISIDASPDAQSPYLVETVQIIQIVPNVDTYHDYRYANERAGVHALSAIGLSKIAAAAGVKWVPEECRVEESTRRPDGHRYLRYRAAGAIRQPNGEWHLEIATRDIDTADEEEELREAKRRARDSARSARNPTDLQRKLAARTDEQIEDDVRRDVLQIRKFILAMAETKAKNRVIRRILALRQTYTAEELRQSFAVPRLVYRPEVAEANLRLSAHSSAELSGGLELEAGDEMTSAPETEEAPAVDREVAEPPAPISETSGSSAEAAVDRSSGGGSRDDAGGSEGPVPSAALEPDEPSEAETWHPPAGTQTTIDGPNRPQVDPSDATTGRKFSELISDETGLARLRQMTESKAPARAEAARAWLAYAEEAGR